MMSKKPILLLDGAMGTMLQKAGLKPGQKPEVFGMDHPDVVLNVHRKYIEAGSGVIYANTFGVNRRKYEGSGYCVRDVIAANIRTAKEAARSAKGRQIKVALDVGPVGEMMEPLGTLSFDDAYDLFKEIVIAGQDFGADLVIFETMADLGEVRAAVLAAKENTSLPVWVTMTFEKNGRTFAGCDPEAMALTLDGLGVEAMGVNCSLGPSDLLPIVQKIKSRTNKPLIVKPNAGMPDPSSGLYAMTPQRFTREMSEYPKMGIRILGGCCGTRPAFISALSESLRRDDDPDRDEPLSSSQSDVPADATAGRPEKQHSASGKDLSQDSQALSARINGVCSAGKVCSLDGNVRVIGERINPTGKKRFQQALKDNDMDYVMKCAIEQTDAGADILDINVGLPGSDEKKLMVDVIKAVQSVTDLPLQIDSSDPEVIEAGLRTACGRVIVNSVNAEEEKCRQILPLVKKYGACVIGLALKKSGMPKTARERIENAETILRFTDEYQIPREDVIIDCLALTISAQQEQAMETLHAVQYLSRQYGVHCTLGVSNISFGLPLRKHITVSFLTQAMFCGVDMPIINPNQLEIMDAVSCYRALSCQDPSCIAYIERFASRQETAPAAIGKTASAASASPKDSTKTVSGHGNGSSISDSTEPDDSVQMNLRKAILRGIPGDVRRYISELIESTDAMDIIEKVLIPALDEVGEKYEKMQIFLPQLINAANAASAGFEVIKNRFAGSEDANISKGKVVLATVEGDIHDIGKNIVKVVLENYGFTVIDLGRDVPPEKVLAAVTEDVKLVGLSALMTTTLPAMEKTIRVLKDAGCSCKTVVGGAVVTGQYAEQIGADYYAKDAKATVDAARQVYS